MKNENVEKLKVILVDEKNRYYIFIGILVFVFLIDYFILMRPQLGALSKLNPEIKLLIDDLERAKVEIAKQPSYQNETTKIKQASEKIILKVKSREEVSIILQTITGLATKNGVRIDQIAPDTIDQKMVLDNKDRKYYSLPITLDAKAAYHDFGRFLNDLEKEDLFLLVQGFSISGGVETRYQNIKLTLRAIIYEESSGKNEKK